MALEKLRQNDMMAHLLEALEQKRDIGHYGRLVFTMVARHFLDEEELVALLSNDPSCDEKRARALVHQVQSRDYNPPRPNRVAEWQRQQDFPICPNLDDPDGCNVYRNLRFPDGIYENIEHYHEQKVEAGDDRWTQENR